MKACKRLELVIEQSQSTRVEKLLQQHQINAYTLIHDVEGRGDRGYRRGNELTDATANCIFIIAIENSDGLTPFLEELRPILGQFGGLCILSDGHFLIH